MAEAPAVAGADVPPAPTAPANDTAQSGYASYVPHDLKYDSAFEDAVQDAVLRDDLGATGANSSDLPKGIRVIYSDSDEAAVEGESARADDTSLAARLPAIAEHELPLQLDDSRRVYASAVPGVRLTHPGGYLEGGPGLEPDMDTFPDDFLSTWAARISSPETLRVQIDAAVRESVEELRVRMRRRREAREKNEQIERDIKVLTDQHSMELRIQNRMAEERRKKKEAKEKRKQAT